MFRRGKGGMYVKQEVMGSSPSLVDFLAYFSGRFPFVFNVLYCVSVFMCTL